jgi:hypothetical protein
MATRGWCAAWWRAALPRMQRGLTTVFGWYRRGREVLVCAAAAGR